MKYCPFCGAELLGADISFCAECGKQLPAGAAPQTEPGTPPVAPDPQRGKNKKASSARPKRNPRKKNKPVIEPHQAEPVINQSVEDTAQDPAFADEYQNPFDFQPSGFNLTGARRIVQM
ncbi:MAG: hypothetical protein IKQ54_00705 [Oscillospiraceae bacterium]|nr:hypothetical protein [Oscillospiraceae bacterium]